MKKHPSKNTLASGGAVLCSVNTCSHILGFYYKIRVICDNPRFKQEPIGTQERNHNPVNPLIL